MKTLRSLVLAVALIFSIVTTSAVMQGCSTLSIFETDPVGATLVTVKDAYESSVRTAGRLYVDKQITEVQLRRFRDEANKFHALYTSVVAAHSDRKLSQDDPRVANLKLAIAGLEALVSSFLK